MPWSTWEQLTKLVGGRAASKLPGKSTRKAFCVTLWISTTSNSVLNEPANDRVAFAVQDGIYLVIDVR